MSLMEKFADPDMMHSLSFADKMAGAGLTTLMGMGITFIILILLWFLISVMTKALHGSKAKKEEAKPVQPAAAATEEKPAEAATIEESETPSAEETLDEVKDEQLVAVITAAIAAAQGPEIMSNLVIRNIRRMAGPTVTWARVGRQECIDSRKMY